MRDRRAALFPLPGASMAAIVCLTLAGTAAVADVRAGSHGGHPAQEPPGLVGGKPVQMDVLHDSGKSIPLAPYLTYLVSSDPKAVGSVMPNLRFPIGSRLKPGVLDHERKVFDAQWLVQPIFLVGADRASIQWLVHNRERLAAIKAWGLVMQAATQEQFRSIQAAAPELRFAPSIGASAPGGAAWLDERLASLGIRVYPVLIDTAGTARQILPADQFGNGGQP